MLETPLDKSDSPSSETLYHSIKDTGLTLGDMASQEKVTPSFTCTVTSAGCSDNPISANNIRYFKICLVQCLLNSFKSNRRIDKKYRTG